MVGFARPQYAQRVDANGKHINAFSTHQYATGTLALVEWVGTAKKGPGGWTPCSQETEINT